MAAMLSPAWSPVIAIGPATLPGVALSNEIRLFVLVSTKTGSAAAAPAKPNASATTETLEKPPR